MKTTPDYDLAPYLASGRRLRAQAFLSAYRLVRDWIKGAVIPASAKTQKVARGTQNA